MLKFGANIWSIPRNKRNVSTFLENTKKIGYQGVELVVDEDDLIMERGELKRKWTRIRGQAEEIGLEIPSIASGLYWKYNIVVGDRNAFKVFETQCYVASLVGADKILVVPGVAVPELRYLDHFDRVAGFFKDAVNIAKEYGITVGLEPVWNKIFPSPLDYKLLLEKIGEDNIGVYFDVGNTLPHSLPEHWIDVLGDKIIQIHVKDFSVNSLEFKVPGQGDVNWYNIRRRLENLGYNGYLVAELPWNPNDVYEPLKSTLLFLKDIFR